MHLGFCEDSISTDLTHPRQPGRDTRHTPICTMGWLFDRVSDAIKTEAGRLVTPPIIPTILKQERGGARHVMGVSRKRNR
jgi:hypothetical protein